MDSEVQIMLEDIELRQEFLNDWELEFYEDMLDMFSLHGSLTPKQKTKLEEIWNRITDSYPTR